MRIHSKSPDSRYVDGLPRYKVHRILKFFGGSPPIKLTKIIADMKLIIKDPKSGKKTGVLFIPQKVADRLRE